MLFQIIARPPERPERWVGLAERGFISGGSFPIMAGDVAVCGAFPASSPEGRRQYAEGGLAVIAGKCNA
jgi:hypothetical protein